jgi:hypothetical protein
MNNCDVVMRVSSRSVLTRCCAALAAAMVVFALCGSAFATPADSLWVANGTNVVEFGPGQLHGVRNTKPQAVLNSPAFASTQGVVFDGRAIYG